MLKAISMFFLVLATLFAQQTNANRSTNPMTAAATVQLADATVKHLLDAYYTAEKQEDTSFSIGKGREVEQRVQERTRMLAGDLIADFSGRVVGHSPTPQETCAGATLLDAAVRRQLENKLGASASPNRKNYEVEGLLSRSPGLQVLYAKIGTCTALQSWIGKPATPAPKK